MPALTDVAICNRALRYVGAEPIVSLEGTEKTTSLCRELYPAVRDRLLASGPWKFAVHRQQLASVVVDENLTPYMHSYALPEDPVMLAPIVLADSEGYERESYVYVIEGQVLYTDLVDPILKYVKQVTDTSVFDEHFIHALALTLASEIAYALDRPRPDLAENARMALSRAYARNREARLGPYRRRPSLEYQRFAPGII